MRADWTSEGRANKETHGSTTQTSIKQNKNLDMPGANIHPTSHRGFYPHVSFETKAARSILGLNR